jgi:hypothetical protein
MTRENVAVFRSELKTRKVGEGQVAALNAESELSVDVLERTPVEGDTAPSPSPTRAEKRVDAKTPPRTKTARLAVDLQGCRFELVVDRNPGRPGEVFVKPMQGGAQKSVPVENVRLVGFVEG